MPANQIARNHEKYIDAYETTWEHVRKCMIDENRYDRQRAQALYVASDYSFIGPCAKFVQTAVRLIMTSAM